MSKTQAQIQILEERLRRIKELVSDQRHDIKRIERLVGECWWAGDEGLKAVDFLKKEIERQIEADKKYLEITIMPLLDKLHKIIDLMRGHCSALDYSTLIKNIKRALEYVPPEPEETEQE